jgi:hypothetical protein
MNQDVDDSVKDTKVDRKDFSAAIAKLLKAEPISKAAISGKVSRDNRSNPRKSPLRGSR